MSQPNIVMVVNKYKIPKGNILFNQLLNSVYQGFRPFGNCPGYEIAVDTQTIEHINSQGGLNVVDLTVATQITRTAKIVVDNLDLPNQCMFLSAAQSTLIQAATPVTNFVIPLAIGGYSYQLGATAGNPAGIRVMGSVVVRVKEGDTATARANSTLYAKGAFYVPATPNAHYYVCTIAGTSAASLPTFSTAGASFADGTATFLDLGLIIVPSTTDVNYKLDSTMGLLSVVTAGTVGVASGLVAALGVTSLYGVGLNVDYTPSAVSRIQIATGSVSQLTGQLLFVADNPYGDNQDVFMPAVTLAASGSLPFVGDAIASMELEVGINQLDTSTPAIIMSNRAA